jgi:hypothetical protein
MPGTGVPVGEPFRCCLVNLRRLNRERTPPGWGERVSRRGRPLNGSAPRPRRSACGYSPRRSMGLVEDVGEATESFLRGAVVERQAGAAFGPVDERVHGLPDGVWPIRRVVGGIRAIVGVVPAADLVVDVLNELGCRDRVRAGPVAAGTASVLVVHKPGAVARECLGGVLAHHRRAQIDVGARGRRWVGGGCGPGHLPRVPAPMRNRHTPCHRVYSRLLHRSSFPRPQNVGDTQGYHPHRP